MLKTFNWRGFCWKDRYGSFVRHRWYVLAPMVLTPLVIVFFLFVAVNRSLNFAALCRESPSEGAALFAEFSRTSIENLLAIRPPPEKSELPTLQLFVSKNTLQDMHVASVSGDPDLGHDPGGDRPYFRAYVRDESNVLQKAKISYRGLMHYHHWPEKPSLRIKVKKSEIALGRRYVELSRPKDVLAFRNQIPEVLARKLDLVSTLNEQVRLFVNNKFFGVYLRSYRPGESLALANGRMPGTFFKGDLVGQYDLYEHLSLWDSTEHWKVFGEAHEADVALFDEFLRTLRLAPTANSLTRLAELIDTERLARWSAVMIVTGCIHTDARHNQTYFYCSNQGKLEIMPWDPTLYEVADRPFTPVDTVNHPVLDRMTRDPRWVHRRNQIIHELINGIASANSLHEHVDEVLSRVLPDLKADAHLSKKATVGRGRVPSSIWDIDDEVNVIKQWATAKEEFLRRYLDEASVAVETNPDRPDEALVHVFGNVAVRVRSPGGKVKLLYPGLSNELRTTNFKPHDVEKEVPCAKAVPMVYRVAAGPKDLLFHNAITGERVFPVTVASKKSATRTIPASSFSRDSEGDVLLGPGEVVLSEDFYVGRRQTLIIRPGTTIRLKPGIGIYSRGKVIAQGTPDNGIRIEAAGDSPWAALGVSGEASANSRFEYVTVAGGSTGSDLGLRFKGMFNVYDCPSVVLRHCSFGANHIGDDAVNLAESVIHVEQCNFANARSDALDLDMCTGSVTHCHWKDSGNDGLDMMGCRVRVQDCTFEGSGDKGISVGEASQVLVRDCHIDRCTIGVEVKDASNVVAMNTTFVANQRAYHSYRKKWLYPRGGWSLLIDCHLRDSRDATLDLEAKTKVWLLRTEAKVDGSQKRIHEVTTIESHWQQLIEELESP